MPITPILLSSQERGSTHVLFNRESDLLFTCAKDNVVSVWYTRNGERLGTFNGHKGAIFGADVTHDSKYLLTSSGDCSVILWDVYTGKELGKIICSGVARSVAWAIGNEMIAVAVNRMSGKPAHIDIYNIEYENGIPSIDPEVLRTLTMPDDCLSNNFTKVFWSSINNHIYSTDDAGYLRKWNYADEIIENQVRLSTSSLTNISVSADRCMLAVSSKDKIGRIVSLLDEEDLRVVKEYKSDRPLNCCSLSPTMNHVIFAGGQDENMVTLSGADQGHFEVQFWHTYHADCFAQVTGHFGPVNCVAFSPNGSMFVSGGEDGVVRLYHFDDVYLKGTY